MRTREKLLEYAYKIKSLGYKVYVSTDEYFHYGYVVNEQDQIGGFQLDNFGTGVCFSTKHKPSTENGSGFGLDDSFFGKTDITKEIVDRCFMVAPNWVSSVRRRKIVKWTATEYLSKEENRNRVEQL